MAKQKKANSKTHNEKEKIKCVFCTICFPHECQKYEIEGKEVYIGNMHLRNINIKDLKFSGNHLIVEKKK